MSVRQRLLIVVASIALPFMVATGALVWSTYERERNAIELTLRDTARALALVVDRELARRESVAWTLATSRALQGDDLARFHERSQQILGADGGWVVVVDDRAQRVNTSVPWGHPLPARSGQRLAYGHRVPSGADISGIFEGPVTSRRAVAISVPVKREGESWRLSVTMLPETLQRVLDEQRLPEGWVGTVLDANGAIVARRPDPEGTIGRPAAAPLRALVATEREGAVRSQSVDAEPTTAVFARSPTYGWTFVITVPDALLGANLRRSVAEAAAWSISLATLAVLVAIAMARRLVAPAARLQAAATALDTGQPVRYEAGDVRELDEAGAALVNAATRLRDANRVLEDRVAAAVEEARRAHETSAASQRLEALGRLTGGVAHDVNNLLAVVANNAVLLSRLPPGMPREPRIAAIMRAVDTGRQLTRKLLSFARRRAPNPTVIELRTWLPAVRTLLQTATGRRVSLAIEAAADVSSVEADASELELALLNLVRNAVDAMPDGGAIRIEAYDEPGGMVAIRVRDSGVGIPADVVPHVFEPFFTTKADGAGSGLGLSQVYGFCEQANGSVRVMSEPGNGTTVTIRLPACRREAPQALASPVAEGGPTRRLLYVEDNDELGEATSMVLSTYGYAIDRVASAEDAWQRIGTHRYDIVLSDILLPGGDTGLALAKRLRASNPSLPVVLTSGYAAEAQQAVAEGFELLPKPCMPEELAATLRRVESARAHVTAG